MKAQIDFNRRSMLAFAVVAAAIPAAGASSEMNMAQSLPSAGLAGHRLQQVSLTTRDLAAATRFYRDVLGLEFLFEANSMAFFDMAGTRLMIGEDHQKTPSRPSSILYFDDPGLEATAAKLEAHGVTFFGPAQVVQTTATHELKLREFADPDGNVLALMGLTPRS
jgi:methylmalonyl-CoA/ethylmalonyl-CoA epimerase